MKATVMYGAGNVRVEKVPDPEIKQPTDVLLRVTVACIHSRIFNCSIASMIRFRSPDVTDIEPDCH